VAFLTSHQILGAKEDDSGGAVIANGILIALHHVITCGRRT
jgi:hypothetical protein